MNTQSTRRIFAAFLLLIPGLAVEGASPQARTFVSAKKGSDSANCGRTSPCRTFNRAISLTSPGGEVVVLDSGGYGAVTISQAVTLEAPDGVYAGMTVSAGDGITVAAGTSDVVVLKGITIIGAGTTGNGITIVSAGTVHIENCTIRGFAAGNGILTTQGLFQHLHVVGTAVSECDTAVRLSPASVQPTVFSQIHFNHSRFENSQTTAMVLQGSDSPVSVQVFVSECYFSGLGGGVGAFGYVNLTLDRCFFASDGLGGQPDVEAGGGLVFISNSLMPNQYKGLLVHPSTSVCVLGNNFIPNLTGTVDHCPLQ